MTYPYSDLVPRNCNSNMYNIIAHNGAPQVLLRQRFFHRPPYV